MATSIATADDLTDILKIQLSSLSTLITVDGYELVCDQAAQELGWSYPMTTPAKVLWMVKRGTRHAINILLLASANKFKYKQVSLNHRFDHFNKLIEEMDKEFEAAINGDLSLFANVDSYAMFGTKIDAGFAYTKYGKDITYEYDQLVNFSPSEE
jgi:hypothetical protein